MKKESILKALIGSISISVLLGTNGYTNEMQKTHHAWKLSVEYSASIGSEASAEYRHAVSAAPVAPAPRTARHPNVSRTAERLKRGLDMSTGPVDMLTTSSIRAGIFGSVAVPFGNLPASKRWNVVYASIGANFPQRCGTDRTCKSRARTLSSAISASSGMGFMDSLRHINATVNRTIAYASDDEIYGQVDYWAKPSETIAEGRGDCEDYAILKMAALKAAGIPSSSMSIVVLRDRKRNLFHAVLAVTTDQGHYILDNVHDRILNDRDVSRYQPLYSLSQKRAWIHGYRRDGGSQIASDIAFDKIAPGQGVGLLSAQIDHDGE